jgi:hypothetical protein
VGKPGGKSPMGKPRRRWEYNIRMDLERVGCVGMEWIRLVQDRDRWRAFVNAVMNIWGFHKIRGISWLDTNRLASQEEICSMEQVRHNDWFNIMLNWLLENWLLENMFGILEK